eukprot:TRINITY_DN9627_c1_g1_i1.p1 TRINITY_DN9627_c1_g1~~TRINITY_DN9627_c1_g1_i1.p1  ORF type:complete len:120 (+),score=0.29 TRINITY_DN9627_c1_g1_i1:173-532(+)
MEVEQVATLWPCANEVCLLQHTLQLVLVASVAPLPISNFWGLLLLLFSVPAPRRGMQTGAGLALMVRSRSTGLLSYVCTSQHIPQNVKRGKASYSSFRLKKGLTWQRLVEVQAIQHSLR